MKAKGLFHKPKDEAATLLHSSVDGGLICIFPRAQGVVPVRPRSDLICAFDLGSDGCKYCIPFRCAVFTFESPDLVVINLRSCSGLIVSGECRKRAPGLLVINAPCP